MQTLGNILIVGGAVVMIGIIGAGIFNAIVYIYMSGDKDIAIFMGAFCVFLIGWLITKLPY